jgi:uncharacterized LabA/DUF88 family protein
VQGNYAYIDGNNIHLGIKNLGWDLDYARFRIYLKEKHQVVKAYYFIGRIDKNQNLYDYLENCGFFIIYKPTIMDHTGTIKGNCDAELVLQVMIDFSGFGKAVIVSGDGDFACLVKHLQMENKLKALLAPDFNKCSKLLKTALPGKITYIDTLRKRLAKK